VRILVECDEFLRRQQQWWIEEEEGTESVEISLKRKEKRIFLVDTATARKGRARAVNEGGGGSQKSCLTRCSSFAGQFVCNECNGLG